MNKIIKICIFSHFKVFYLISIITISLTNLANANINYKASYKESDAEAIIQQELEYLETLEAVNTFELTHLEKMMSLYITLKGFSKAKGDKYKSRLAKLSDYEKKALSNQINRAPKLEAFKKWAKKTEKLYCGKGHKSGTVADAFRHLLGSAMMAYSFDSETARELTTSHEKKYEPLDKKQWESEGFTDQFMTGGETEIINGQLFMLNWTTAESHMDLYNNYLGRQIAENIPGHLINNIKEVKKIIIERALKTIKQGQVIVLRDSQKPCYDYPYYSKKHQQTLDKK